MTLEAGMKYEPDSSYVNQHFYDWLVELSNDLRNNIDRCAASVDTETERAITHFLNRECRLLDDQQFDRWLDLYDEQCAYWIPAERDAANPRQKVTLEFHDRRRLIDRVARLGTGLAYSQWPASRTSRLCGDLEIWLGPDAAEEWRVRRNFIMAEHQGDHVRILAGWYGFALRRSGGTWKIVVKQVNLLDCDLPQGNNSFFL